MWLSQIKVRDFRCFYGEQSVDFSQDPKKNVTLIHAENGVGKTTLLNALLWCFYGEVTEKFEKREDLVNHDARKEGRTHAFVEVLFEHNENRYRARRFTKGGTSEREFSVMRIDGGSHLLLPNADAFINTVIPKSMAGHFLFDGEHAEVFLGEDNRREIRRAVQDILGCSLIETAIGDLAHAATYYRQQMPNSKASTSIATLSSRIDALDTQIAAAILTRDGVLGEVEVIDQQIADIEDKLRNSAATKALQARRDKTKVELARTRTREVEAQNEILKWLGDNGRFIVSSRIADQAMSHLDQEETKGRLPSPYNEEFVNDLLEMKKCICGSPLEPGTEAHACVQGLLQKAANATLRSRIGKVKARLSELRLERTKAPVRLEAANRRLADARADISRHEQDLNEVSEKLSGIDIEGIAEREERRNALRRDANTKRDLMGQMKANIERSTVEKASAERDLKRVADEDAGAKVFVGRYALCERLKGELEKELKNEEQMARRIIRGSISRILDATSRKAFKLNMSDDYAVSLVNDAGTQMAKSSGENQLLGLAFTAALVEFAKLREKADGYRLLRGTIAPLVLDSPFGQLDDDYRATTAEYVPQMASQVILMVSKSQGTSSVMDPLRDRIGEEYVLIRHNKAERGERRPEVRNINGKDVDTAVFDGKFDGSEFVRVTR